MKTLIIKVGFVILFLFIMGAGCEKDSEDDEYLEIEFSKFSDFGCENDYSWYLKPGYVGKNHIITSQKVLEECIAIECNPQIDFSDYVLLIGVKQFNSGATLYDEKVEENNSEVVYTVTFLKDITTVALGVSYHAIINKPSIGKSIRIVEIVKEAL